ncbi:MAG: glycine zipper 2TM domain-containing protein [Desulfobacterales bacterium]|nr:glycine zipper 2TM domain-containing protein [Desulfobacterales bacterium]
MCLIPLLLMLTSCISSRSGQVYSRDQARVAQTVVNGTVESVRTVTIEGTQTPVGTVAGGVLGGVLGSTIGDGSGQAVATVAGALAGAVAGSAAEEKFTQKQGLEIVVQKDNGGSVLVVQEADIPFAPGDRVRVITGPDGTTRVAK